MYKPIKQNELNHVQQINQDIRKFRNPTAVKNSDLLCSGSEQYVITELFTLEQHPIYHSKFKSLVE